MIESIVALISPVMGSLAASASGAAPAIVAPPQVSHLLEAAPFAVAMRDTPWLFAAVEILHILSFSLVLGCAFISDFRILGIGKDLSVRALHRITIPLALAASPVIILTGLLMFSAHANDVIDKPAFLYKMLLLFAAIINALIFLTGPYQGAATWDVGTRAPGSARLGAAISMVLWIAVVCCGRLIRSA